MNNETFTLRLPKQYINLVGSIAKEKNKSPNKLISEYVIEGVEKNNSDKLIENSKFGELSDDLKDILSSTLIKTENRIASLLSKILITSHETNERASEIIKKIFEETIDDEEKRIEVIEEIDRKVNTAAIVNLKKINSNMKRFQ